MKQAFFLLAAAISVSASVGLAQSPGSGPYRILRTARVGGAGGFDYVYADSTGRPATPPGGAPAGGRGGRGQMVADSFSILEIGK